MSELNAPSDTDPAIDETGADAEELAEAYAALDEDRRLQELAAVHETVSAERSQIEPVEALIDDIAGTEEAETAPPLSESQTSVHRETTNAEAMDESNRRVFLIDGKAYPDPDPNLPITGNRSVQAMYRDYFPGQLDNADAVQKTRPDGTVEVTFKRRIGTKGNLGRSQAHQLNEPNPGETVVTSARVASVIAALSEDRPLVWDLIEQAMAPDGTLRLDYVPPAAQLNLAEAQNTARVRLIELALNELRRLRPSA